MKVRMQATMAGPDGVVQSGRVIEVSAEMAATLVEGGYAEYVEPSQALQRETEIETADVEAPEQAITHRKKVRKKK